MDIPTDWVFGLLGGLIIGGAASMFLLINGRIMGASGLLGGLLDGTARSAWREHAAFIAGLIVAPGIAAWVFGAPDTHVTTSVPLLIAAGLLVGIGTRIANGCTSGHGVCGISRFSLRSIIATGFYLLGGGVMMLVARHLLEVI